VEREPTHALSAIEHYTGSRAVKRSAHRETDWEERIEARSPEAALEAFFRQRVSDRSQVRRLDERGESQPVRGLDYGPQETYIWIEGGQLMEYQGMDEVNPGMVTCPMCSGDGEVDSEIAEEFLAEHDAGSEEDRS
jgi:hypothetical protein